MKLTKLEVNVNAGEVTLGGNLNIPEGASAIVVFAHGSGSSRFSPRNVLVADVLNNAGLATLLFDLLTPSEEKVDNITAQLRFNIEFLASRLVQVCKWVNAQTWTRNMSIGLFGASTGGGAALLAAANASNPSICAVVSRGGRPDLAGNALPHVRVPTLLIVGGEDHVVIQLNEKSLHRLTDAPVKELKIVPGATHLFEEPGTLQQVASLAFQFFLNYLPKSQSQPQSTFQSQSQSQSYQHPTEAK